MSFEMVTEYDPDCFYAIMLTTTEGNAYFRSGYDHRGTFFQLFEPLNKICKPNRYSNKAEARAEINSIEEGLSTQARNAMMAVPHPYK